MGLCWWIVGVFAFLTIIGIPWGKACFVIGSFSFFPFGKEPVSRSHNGQSDIGTGALGTVGNIIWFVLAGWWLVVGGWWLVVGNWSLNFGSGLFYYYYWHSIWPTTS